MNSQNPTIEEIYSTLTRLRQGHATRKNFLESINFSAQDQLY